MKYLQRLLGLLAISVAVFSCQKEYSVENNGGASGTTAQWSFTEGSSQFKGPIDTVYVDSLGSSAILTINGHSSDNKDEIALEILGTNLKAGVYKTPYCLFAYMRNGSVVYQTDQTAIDSFTINITKLDSTGIAGTFSGRALFDTTKALRKIVDGKFSAVFKTSTPTPPASTDSGQVVLWSKAGCGGGTSTSPISVSVGGKNGQITTFTSTEPTNCDQPGSFYIKLPVGTYPMVAKCGTDSISGTVTITKNTCTKVQVDFTAPPVTATDYFPVTTGSNWASLYEGGGPADSAYTLSTGKTFTANGNTYNVFGYIDYKYQYDDTLYYRKGSGIYYEYFPATTNYFQFDTPTAVEFVMLNENLAVGAPFPTSSISGTISGNAVTAKINGKILEKNVSVTISGKTYSNVIKVQNSISSVVLGVTVEVGRIEQWFAKGYGIIKYEEYITPPFTTPDNVMNTFRTDIK